MNLLGLLDFLGLLVVLFIVLFAVIFVVLFVLPALFALFLFEELKCFLEEDVRESDFKF